MQAAVFHKFMSSGRTSPALCGCENESGEMVGDFVVKLSGGTERRKRGMLCEWIGSHLATYFGIATPSPELVTIDASFADLVASVRPDKGAIIQSSVGLNFGSKHLTDLSGLPVDKSVPNAMWQQAVDIFAFDALIENPDRRFSNPNLLTRGDAMIAFDHELAFSGLELILPDPKPWLVSTRDYLKEHVFFRQLKSKPIDLTGFTGALTALPKKALPRLVATVPDPWKNGDLAKIEGHLRLVAANAKTFAEEVRRRLA